MKYIISILAAGVDGFIYDDIKPVKILATDEDLADKIRDILKLNHHVELLIEVDEPDWSELKKWAK